ncbi:luc7-like protein 3 isoform X2 [Corticium candelabrum]|uniref:luc7-like protein 3 isoform X2 n=1 Tax=Corticium candelabrum TaxID=121492 RepID=UPI002E27209F|nr:luc7-like protein 3 isoform X2 [Corticium candelabrum]
MTTDASALLDELMGRTRNLLPSEKHLANERRWSDSDVCKYFLCGFCPHELFTNTKADLGSCSKVHDEELKRNYEESDSKWKRGYEEDFLRYLESIVGDMDKKIDRGRGRLKQNEEYVKEETKRMPPEKTERVKKLSEAISQQVQKMEDLGNDGLVEEAQEVMQKVEQLKRERDTILMANKSALAIMLDDNVEKRMEVCDVCGSFLVVNDLQVRVDAHVSGKQHRGFAMLRDKIREVKVE